MVEKEKDQMFQVRCGNEVANFPTLNEAKAFAEKESWIQTLKAEIKTPDGKTIVVKIGNVP